MKYKTEKNCNFLVSEVFQVCSPGYIFFFQINFTHFTGKYRLCQQFLNNQACRIGEGNCTFSHSEVESDLWVLDGQGAIDLHVFVLDHKRYRTQGK